MKEAKIELAGLRFSSNRAYGGEGEIKILAEDIKRNGLINPITVKESKEGFVDLYEVIAGRRRVQAVTLLGWKDIPCRILEGDETERADEIAGSENINRLAMHPLDEATVFNQLLESGRSIEELAKQYDRKKSEIWQRVQLLDLNEDIKTLFRNGNLTLQAAAMLKSVDADGQKAFYKEFKNCYEVKRGGEIDANDVERFISNIGHDRLYSFLRDKQCAECKTRTFFSDKNLFPELDDVSENCFKHECYMQKWNRVLSGRIKSLKGEHKSHAQADVIATDSDRFQKLAGKKITVDGIDYKVLPYNYTNRAQAKEKDAKPCFVIDISHSGNLKVTCEYWAAKAEAYSYSGYSSKSDKSPAVKRKEFAPVVKLLDLPAEQENEALEAMSNSKRISLYGLKENVRTSAFWKIVDIKAQEFNDPKHVQNCRETFLEKYFSNLHGSDKKIYDTFVGKLSIVEIANMPPDKIFSLICAMEFNFYDMPDLEELSKGKKEDILKWIALAPEKLKEVYQEEIRKRIPKQKPEPKKPVEKKQAQPKTPTANKSAKQPAAKKPIPKEPAAKKPHTGLLQGKGKGKKK
jgi:ParB family chromosome partitioning protein